MTDATCPHCGKANPPEVRFCLGCGAALSTAPGASPPPVSACSRCGTPTRPGAAFCPVCGAKLENPVPVPQTFRGAPPVPVMTSPVKARRPAGFTALSLLALVLTAGFIALLAGALIGLRPDLARFSGTEERTALTVPAEFTYEESEKLRLIAAAFRNPAEPPAVLPAALQAPADGTPPPADPLPVDLEGEVLRVRLAENLLGRDWPQAYVLTLRSSTGLNTVLYRGAAGLLRSGDRVRVRGLAVESGGGILADRVENLSPLTHTDEETLWLMRAAAGVFLYGMACLAVFLWRAQRVRWLRTALPLMLLGLLLGPSLSACSMNVHTTLLPDGSGRVGLTIGEKAENVSFLRQIPGVADLMDAWIANARAAGMQVDESRQGEEQIIFVQRPFGRPDELAQAALLPGEGGSWVYAEQFREGDVLVTRYTALVDTSALLVTSEDTDPQAASQMRSEMSAMDFRYTLSLPGEVAYHNGAQQSGNQLTWQLRMDDSNQIVAESRLVTAPQGLPPRTRLLAWAGIGAAFGLFTLLLVLGFRLFRLSPREVTHAA